MVSLRFWGGLAAGVALAYAAIPAFAQSSEPLELEPAAQWGLDYGDNACTLFRRFTSAEGEVDLRIEQVAPGHLVNVIASSEQFDIGRGSVSIQVEPGTGPRVLEQGMRGRAGALRVVRFTDFFLPEAVPFATLGDAASIAQFRQLDASIAAATIINGFDRPIRLQLGNMASAMNAMRGCVDDLLSSWGMDPQIAATVAVVPVRVGQSTSARRVMEAYPRDMLFDGRSARVTVVMVVGADGRVAQCHAHNPEPYPVFEEVTCERLTEYARYEPARDANGNPVSGFDTMEVVFTAGG